VVHLKPEEVPEPVRQERWRDAVLERFLRAAAQESVLEQYAGEERVRALVERNEVDAGAKLAAERLLHRVDRVAQSLDLGRMPHRRPRDIRAVAEERGSRVDQQRRRALGRRAL